MDRLHAVVEYLVRGLVDEPDMVRVTAVESGGVTVYQIAVAPDDLGKIIGREGRTANALRQVVRAASVNLREKATVDILS